MTSCYEHFRHSSGHAEVRVRGRSREYQTLTAVNWVCPTCLLQSKTGQTAS